MSTLYSFFAVAPSGSSSRTNELKAAQALLQLKLHIYTIHLKTNHLHTCDNFFPH